MKGFVVALDNKQVKQLDAIMKHGNVRSEQYVFELLVENYLDLLKNAIYWQDQHAALSAEYKRLSEQLEKTKEELRICNNRPI